MPLILQFGKYKGRTLDRVPSSYLRTLSEEFADDDVADAADEEYRYREDHDAHWEEE